MALFGGYESSGVGVAKNAPKKKPFFEFWDIYGRRFWKMICLSLLTFVCCIPVITIGPAIAGMTKVLRRYALDKNSFMLHDFKRGFCESFGRSFLIGILDIICFVSVACGLYVYPSIAEIYTETTALWYIFCAMSVAIGVVIFMMNFYIFPMIVATELSMKNIIKNSFFLTCLTIKKNLITFFAIVLVCIICVLATIIGTWLGICLFPVWGFSFMGLISVFNSYPIIQKYVIDPYYKEKGMENPEYGYGAANTDEALFSDMGGKEKPIEKKKKKKGKTIS